MICFQEWGPVNLIGSSMWVYKVSSEGGLHFWVFGWGIVGLFNVNNYFLWGFSISFDKNPEGQWQTAQESAHQGVQLTLYMLISSSLTQHTLIFCCSWPKSRSYLGFFFVCLCILGYGFLCPLSLCLQAAFQLQETYWNLLSTNNHSIILFLLEVYTFLISLLSF